RCIECYRRHGNRERTALARKFIEGKSRAWLWQRDLDLDQDLIGSKLGRVKRHEKAACIDPTLSTYAERPHSAAEQSHDCWPLGRWISQGKTTAHGSVLAHGRMGDVTASHGDERD